MKLACVAPALLATLVLACGGSPRPSPAPAASAEPTAPAPAEAPAAPTIGPDECCCPLASAEGITYNVSPKADCEAAGTGCVEPSSCQ